jgi:Protein of unknown function (DUF2877)
VITTPAPGAIAIALPLWQSLRANPFAGAVAGRFARACTLVDDQGRVIALTLPALGNGPFSISVGADAGLFMELTPDQRAYVDTERIVVGSWHIPLTSAHIWDARLPSDASIQCVPAITAILQPYAQWPARAANTSIAAATTRLLARGARALHNALEQRHAVAAAARQLAGLGAGLTPAGDDYLVGVMAALWLLGDRELAPIIAQSAAPHTTRLSSAFLLAAAQGQFAEPWHQLARALACQSASECGAAVQRIAEIGASSGRDALAGFVNLSGAAQRYVWRSNAIAGHT